MFDQIGSGSRFSVVCSVAERFLLQAMMCKVSVCEYSRKTGARLIAYSIIYVWLAHIDPTLLSLPGPRVTGLTNSALHNIDIIYK